MNPDRQAPCRVLTVASPAGGSGKTLLATNLAAHLAGQGRRALLVDLDLQSGGATAVLQAAAPGSVHGALYDEHGDGRSPARVGEELSRQVQRHPLGFDLLAAPADPALAEDVTAADVGLLVTAARERYDAVVVDTPPVLTDPVLAAVDGSDVVAVLAPLEIAALRRLTALLDVLGRLDVPPARLRLVLNRVEAAPGLDIEQVQDAFAGAFVARLPWQPGVAGCADRGGLLVADEPDSPLARALVRLAGALLPEATTGAPQEAGPRP